MTLRAITFDIDWAPDWCIELCADICAESGIPAAFFVTHDTPAVRDLVGDERFETGIHPNFLPGSSHGETVEEVIDFCLSITPETKLMRTHALVQSTVLLARIVGHAPQIEIDSSLYLPGARRVDPIETYMPPPPSRLIRLPVIWEDDLAVLHPDWDPRGPLPRTEGIEIFNFHPIHVALNLRTLDQYSALKSALGSRRLYEASESEAKEFTVKQAGVRDFLMSVITAYDTSEFVTLAEMAHPYLES